MVEKSEREILFENIKEMLDRIEDMDDVGEWFSDSVLDVEYTIDSRGELKEVGIQISSYTWLYLDGSNKIRIEKYECCKEPIKIIMEHPKGEEIFDYLEELGNSLICKH